MRCAKHRLLLALLITLSIGGSACSLFPSRRPNVILISIDTLRADRLGLYGYERRTSPELDAFASKSAVFERAVAESGWTLPSHATMLTGLAPRSHGVVQPSLEIANDVPLLAEILRSEGYRTYGSSDGGYVSKGYGFGRGFEKFNDRRKGFRVALAEARKWVDRVHVDEPFFLFLHAYDVHCPYDPKKSLALQFRSPQAQFIPTKGRCGNPFFNSIDLTPGQVRFLSDNYDAGIRQVDGLIGSFLEWLDSSPHRDNTVVVITSDHGEEFKEHGQIGHERTLHREVLMIPMLIAGPGVRAARYKVPVGLSEITPTILDLVGLESTPEMDGTSLASLLRGASLPDLPAARHSQIRWKGVLDSVVVGDLHLILDSGTGSVELYSLSDDPLEQKNLQESRGEEVAELRQMVGRFAAGEISTAPDRDGISADERERLRALGYTE
jgi:arylsulfatase A-like enzyme